MCASLIHMCGWHSEYVALGDPQLWLFLFKFDFNIHYNQSVNSLWL